MKIKDLLILSKIKKTDKKIGEEVYGEQNA